MFLLLLLEGESRSKLGSSGKGRSSTTPTDEVRRGIAGRLVMRTCGVSLPCDDDAVRGRGREKLGGVFSEVEEPARARRPSW